MTSFGLFAALYLLAGFATLALAWTIRDRSHHTTATDVAVIVLLWPICLLVAVR